MLLTVAGFQVPLMPLVDVVGSTGAAAPLHMEGMAAKVGVMIGLTVTVTCFVSVTGQIPTPVEVTV